MATKRPRKRRRVKRLKNSESKKSAAPNGWFVVGTWVVSLVLVGITYFNYGSQMSQNGYARLSVPWLFLLVILVLITIGGTVQWLRSRSDANLKDMPK